MHAKMTRDRKKNFVASIEKTILELETTNRHMKKVLADVVQTHFKKTAVVVPYDDEQQVEPPMKKSRHSDMMIAA